MSEFEFENYEKLKEELIEFFNNPRLKNKTYKFKEIRKHFSLLKGYKINLVRMALQELELEGKILYDNKRDLYRAFPKDLGYVQGNIKINKNIEGLVKDENGLEYLIETKDLKDSLDGDIVIARATKKRKNGHAIAKVEKILKRKSGMVVVEVCINDKGEYYLRPFNAYLEHPIIINAVAMKPLVEGDRIVVKISELNEKGSYYAGFIKNIGHKDDPDADLKIIAIQNNIVIDFSKEALEEADMLPTEVTEEEKVDRLDLTNKLIFSIDGEKTKDRDDAVSIEINDRGNYIVGAHISDVSHYIHPGMKLWDEAMQRGNSVYMADTVIPMLPHKLSNGICSLNPDVDRLTLSCIMEISPQGEIIGYDFVDTVINSRKAMTYEEVNKIFEEGDLPPDYVEFYDALELMRQLSVKREKIKEKRGYTNFGCNDIEYEFDKDGNVIEIKKKEQRIAEKIIENIMLLAGECYANYMMIPTPYRVHEEPEEERVEEALELLGKSGIKVRTSYNIINGKVIQQILKQIEDMSVKEIASQILLRSMSKAKYDVEPIGHFGLGLKKYGHFTSPIRRAADLQAHYNIRLQRDNKYCLDNTERFYEEMNALCHHISTTEGRADQAERDADKLEMIKFMSNHLGEKFEVHVSYLTSKVIFVKTSNGIEGRIYPEDIEGDTFNYVDRGHCYQGKRTHTRIKIGTELVVTALEADRDFGAICFGVEACDLPIIKTKRKGA